MGVKPEDIQRAVAGGNKVMAQLYPEGQYNPIHPELPATIPLPKKRIRQRTKPLLNSLETNFFWSLKAELGPIIGAYIRSQALRFKLANGLWYKPDFTLIHRGLCKAWEVKGPFAYRGGFENLKMAATTYPEWVWVLVWKEGGLWKEQAVLP